MDRMLGPFVELPFSTLQISPIGLVLKTDGSWHLITILSYPHDYSINSFIEGKYCKVTYTSFDSISKKNMILVQRALLRNIDIKSAFRLLILNPADFDFKVVILWIKNFLSG